MPSIFIISAADNPLPLHIGGRSVTLPVGKDVEVADVFLPLLDDTPSVTWRFTGEAAEPGEIATQPDPTFDADAVIDGTVSEVAERLAALAPEQLLAVRAAEEDREVARKGVVAAINKAISARNEG